MFGKKAIATVGAAIALGAAGSAVAMADTTVPTDPDMKLVLQDYREHVGERFRVHGLVYSDAAAWTLVYVTDEPSEFYTIDGARAEVVRPTAEPITQGDIFTGTISITGRAGFNDPVVMLEDVRIVGRQW
ncbi:hypothetical protein [Nocardia sp. IFM 10818]